ncbi:MAG: hypothetical protein QNJ69_07530 [Gammaproteobacteria bacterium]|nr:hypothetical protein [Gammaproteobacteria bacterium]
MGQANQLQQALDLTKQILRAIEEVDLDTVAELDRQRQMLIEEYYQQDKQIDAGLTRQLKQSNDEVVTQLHSLQKNTRTRQLQLRQSTHASNAYRANAPKKVSSAGTF